MKISWFGSEISCFAAEAVAAELLSYRFPVLGACVNSLKANAFQCITGIFLCAGQIYYQTKVAIRRSLEEILSKARSQSRLVSLVRDGLDSMERSLIVV